MPRADDSDRQPAVEIDIAAIVDYAWRVGDFRQHRGVARSVEAYRLGVGSRQSFKQGVRGVARPASFQRGEGFGRHPGVSQLLWRGVPGRLHSSEACCEPVPTLQPESVHAVKRQPVLQIRV